MAQPIHTFEEKKDPEAVLDYTIDWSPWLKTGDFITASSWNITPPGALSEVLSSFSNTTTTIWLEDGDRNRIYYATCHIVTNDGREDDRTIKFTMRDK